MAETILIPRAPSDHKTKKPKGIAANPNAIDLGEEDDGQTEYPTRFLRDDKVWYSAHLPKGIVALRLGQEMEAMNTENPEEMLAKIMEFVATMFTPEDAATIEARIMDPADRLDFRHVMSLVRRLSEKATGLPTT
jgi:hypothetical protein